MKEEKKKERERKVESRETKNIPNVLPAFLQATATKVDRYPVLKGTSTRKDQYASPSFQLCFCVPGWRPSQLASRQPLQFCTGRNERHHHLGQAIGIFKFGLEYPE